jgi:PHD/YefM family antitoxin component YafN of YafNO toxin-antitoxin module
MLVGRTYRNANQPSEYESLIETLEVLSDHELMAALEESDEDTAAGRLIPWDEVKRDLGLA